MLPSLRLGFVIPPAWAMRTLVAAKNALDWHCSVPLQMAVAAFIKDGHLGRHVRRMRRIYRQRRDRLVELLKSDRGEGLEPIPSSYGLHVTATLARGTDTEAASEALAKRGIFCHALTRYFMGPPTRSGFVISYALADLDALETAVTALAEELALQKGAKPVPAASGSATFDLSGPS
jgi:GntR family transcriptional regulator/MocR family aminotransferase